MATIEIKKVELNRILNKGNSADYLINKLTNLGMSVESTDLDTITVEVNPNRPDFLSVYGIARALKSSLGIKRGLIKYNVKKSNYKLIIDSEMKTIRPFTACCVVKNLKFDAEDVKNIIQFQEKLHITLCRNRKKAAIGIYPLDKIKFPIHFKALEPNKINFKPLDYGSELNGNQILKEHETGKKYADLLKNMTKYPVFIDPNKNILSMPPIINSETVGKITTKTKDVFVEVSGFDLDFLKQVLNIIVADLADMGGTIYEIEVSGYNKKMRMPELSNQTMKLDINYANRLLGINLKETEAKLLLEKMGFGYSGKSLVTIPSYRIDVIHPIDLVEDIAISYGYDRFNPKVESFYSIAEENPRTKIIEKMRELMMGHGFLEVNMPHLTNNENMNIKMNTSLPYTSLKNSINQDYNILRSWIIPSLMEVLSINKHNEYPQDLFEIGTAFQNGEKTKFSVVIAHSKANFTEAKQLIEYLMKTMKIDYQIKETSDIYCFIEGRVASLIVDNKEIGIFGEIHPRVLNNWGMEVPVAAFEIEFDILENYIRKFY